MSDKTKPREQATSARRLPPALMKSYTDWEAALDAQSASGCFRCDTGYEHTPAVCGLSLTKRLLRKKAIG